MIFLNNIFIEIENNFKSHSAIEKAAQKILSPIIKHVLIIIPSFEHTDFSHTYYTDGSTTFWLSSQNCSNTYKNHVKSILSLAIKILLNLNYNIKDAVVIAQMYLNQRMRLSQKIDNADALLQQWSEQEIDMPFLATHPINKSPTKFNDLDTKKIGIYPIIDSSAWLEKLLPLDIHTFQLRIKNKQGTALEKEIQKSIDIAKKNNKKLFINDHWKLAILNNAYGVHLGQEDLNTADIASIQKAGLRLGISSHCYYEVARAHAFNPSYIACGPIFTTTSKVMPFAPQGLLQLARWRRTLDYPLVAIGGINSERLPAVLATNVDGIAMISAITKADDPIKAAKNMVKQYANN